MTTKNGARIYRGAPDPLQPGACPHCGRSVAIGPTGRRRSHRDRSGLPCTGGRVLVGRPRAVLLEEQPAIVIPPEREHRPRPTGQRREKPPDPRRCVCGWRPRSKGDGTFVAHRIRPDDPSAPYCPNGSERSR